MGNAVLKEYDEIDKQPQSSGGCGMFWKVLNVGTPVQSHTCLYGDEWCVRPGALGSVSEDAGKGVHLHPQQG